MGVLRVARVDDGPLWAIASSYFSPALIEHAKCVPGIRFEKQCNHMRNVWVGYPDAVNAVVARLKTQGIVVLGADDLPESDSWRHSRTPFLFSTKGLRDYQVEGVRFLIARSGEGALLADGMRLGKSLQAIVAARAFKQKTLVVCPSHIVGVWGRSPDANEGPGEIAKWWPDAWKPHPETGARGVFCLSTVKPHAAQVTVRTLTKKKKDGALAADDEQELTKARAEIVARSVGLQDATVIVCHYDILYAWVDVLKAWGFKTLILDEIHIAAGWQSRRSDALKDIASFATRRIGLSGTPLTTRVRQLHNILEILAPARFGYFFTGQRPGCYSKVFCAAFQETVGKGEFQKTVWNFQGKSNIDEPDGELTLTKEETLAFRLRYLMLRRIKKDVDRSLPVKVRQIVDVVIPPRKMIGVSTNMLVGDGKELRRSLDLAADGKLKPVVALVENHIAEDEKVLCFCYRRAFAETVADQLEKRVAGDALVVCVHGGMPRKERDAKIQSLRKHNGPGALVCTIDTTSTGIDLSFSQIEVVAELTWEPWELEQVEERIYEYGNDAKGLIQYVIARGTGDELILRGIIDVLDTGEKLGVSPGDEMKRDLGARRTDGLKRLRDAMVAMQAAAPPTATRRKRLVT
jgi:SNF2 family DNA or RNA helicase